MQDGLKRLKEVVCSQDGRETSFELLTDLAKSLRGDFQAIAKLASEVAKAPMFIRNQLFWMKFTDFLLGIHCTDEEAAAFSAKMVEEGTEQENATRIIYCIDRCETKEKVGYVLAATHCWMHGHVSKQEYFRMIKQISETLLEALDFLKNNDLKQQYCYTDIVQDLVGAGLMYAAAPEKGGGMLYAFTPSAMTLDKYALSYNDMSKYRYDCEESLPPPEMRSLAVFG